MSYKLFNADEILDLRKTGKTYKQIASIVGCHYNTVCRYLRPERRAAHNVEHIWVKENRPSRHKRQQLTKKMYHFQRRGVSIENRSTFTIDEVKTKFEKNKTCYLTGRPLSWDDPTNLHFDHIKPASRGGSNELSNMGFTCEEANTAKRNRTPEEHLAYCLEVVKYAGYKITKE